VRLDLHLCACAPRPSLSLLAPPSPIKKISDEHTPIDRHNMTEHDRQTAPSFALHEHSLDYFPDLRVGEEVFTRRFDRACSMGSCSAFCCREGVIVDVRHRDHVLANAPLILEHMEATQMRDSTRWFEPTEMDDADFPSGRACNTEVVNGTCVFLDSRRRCVLQLAESQSPGLKPFYCRTYPIVIIDARVTLDDEHCPGETQCCGPVSGGQLSALDVCREELVFMLGEPAAQLDELRRLEVQRGPRHDAEQES
jgi:Fe-S-cluster containining protein